MTEHPTAAERLTAQWAKHRLASPEWLEQLCAHVDEGHPIGEPAAQDLLREVLRLRAVDAASPASGGEWRAIETAPKDGRLALVYRPLAHMSGDEPVTVKRLIGGKNYCWESTVPKGQKPCNPTDGSCHVTHWMPLLAPPGASPSPSVTEGHGTLPNVGTVNIAAVCLNARAIAKVLDGLQWNEWISRGADEMRSSAPTGTV
jgi:hypothetical protein